MKLSTGGKEEENKKGTEWNTAGEIKDEKVELLKRQKLS